MNNPNNRDGSPDRDFLNDMIAGREPVESYLVCHQVDVYDLSARFDADFFCQSDAKTGRATGFGRDMTFEFVEIEIMKPCIAELDEKLRKAKGDTWEAFSAGHYPWKPDLTAVTGHVAAARQHIIDAHSYLSDLQMTSAPLAEILSQIRHPIDPGLRDRIDTIATDYRTGAAARITDRYRRITRLGRSQDREKAIIDGAVHALDAEDFAACREFIEMIGDDEIITIMLTYLSQIERARDVLRISYDTCARDLRIMLMTRFTPIPQPDEQAA